MAKGDPNDNAAAFEQFESVAISVATVIASYYEKLIQCGVPDAVAVQLAVNFQTVYLGHALDSQRTSPS